MIYTMGKEVFCICIPWIMGLKAVLKVVLEGYRRCLDSHDPSECQHLYDLGRHI